MWSSTRDDVAATVARRASSLPLAGLGGNEAEEEATLVVVCSRVTNVVDGTKETVAERGKEVTRFVVARTATIKSASVRSK